MSLPPAFADFHTEGAPFIGQRIGIHDFARRPGQLEVVLIINNDQIIQCRNVQPPGRLPSYCLPPVRRRR
ncbi:hypothetical protein IE981_09290 [Klebsiella pneumoniae]|nr:hypothetical protein [Klebsiella pneumoniae]